MKLQIITRVSFLISVLTGCAGDNVEVILPQDGPTMKEVYNHHFTGAPLPEKNEVVTNESETDKKNTLEPSSSHRPHRPLSVDYELDGYTRNASNEINQLFPRIANPTLVMYIYPHLVGAERHPVPGYSTAFSLYKKVEYALPGELGQGY